MEIKTNELSGIALDWAVAKCEGAHPQISYPDKRLFGAIGDTFDYSTNWAQGGPIIEREAHNLFKHNGGKEWCCACNVPREGYAAIITADGPTPLIAAMRCLVASKLGDEVDVPDGLLS